MIKSPPNDEGVRERKPSHFGIRPVPMGHVGSHDDDEFLADEKSMLYIDDSTRALTASSRAVDTAMPRTQ